MGWHLLVSKNLALYHFFMIAGIDESIKVLFQKQYISKKQHASYQDQQIQILKEDYSCHQVWHQYVDGSIRRGTLSGIILVSSVVNTNLNCLLQISAFSVDSVTISFAWFSNSLIPTLSWHLLLPQCQKHFRLIQLTCQYIKLDDTVCVVGALASYTFRLPFQTFYSSQSSLH